MTDRVAGDAWEVDNLTQPGQEPHDLELTIAQTAELEDADLVVLNHGFQPAVDSGAETADAPVLDAADAVELLPADADDHEGETEEEHAEHAGEEHDHGDTDPHFWLDPLLVADFGDAVADELTEVDPDGAQTLRGQRCSAAPRPGGARPRVRRGTRQLRT